MMEPEQEREIARGLRAGEPDAWRALYDAYARRVWQSAARWMGATAVRAADVADVVQETFLAAARSARNYDPARGSLWMWLCGIARNSVALHFRKQARQERLRQAGEWLAAGNQRVVRWLENREADPGEVLAAAELATIVRTVLTEIPLDYETLLTARYLDDVSVEQIAGQQQCSTTAVRSKLARARQAFREAFVKTSTYSPDGHARQPHAS
jgi:RNA polymerase sigma-70 factor (ECF subfamily)